MRVVIHQPDHLGYLGFYHKIMRADKYVILDNVQYAKREFIHRNRIRGPKGPMWLSVPVLTKGRFYQKIRDVEIDPTQHWKRKHWGRILHCYSKAKHFKDYADIFEAIYSHEWKKLVDLNIHIIEAVFKILELDVDMCLASELGVSGKGTELLIKITKAVGGNTYLSGPGGKNYMDESLFEKEGVKLEYDNFIHPVYEQVYDPFIPNMAVIDLLFNCGQDAINILRGASKWEGDNE